MFTVGKFIVFKRGEKIDDFIHRGYDRGKDWVMVEYTIPGQVVFSIGETVPVILHGTGCIGTGIVNEFTVTKLNTTIVFSYHSRDIKDSVSLGLYKYYQMQNGETDSAKSTGGGFILPGLGGEPAMNNSYNDKGNKRRTSKKYEDDYDPFYDDQYEGW